MSNNQSVVYKVVGVNGIVFPKVSHPTELELEYSKTLPLEVVTLITRPERNTVDVEIIGSDNSTIKVLTYSPKSDAPVIIFQKSYPIRNNKVILRTFTHRVESNTIKEILACISMIMKLTVVDEVEIIEGSLSAVVFSDGEVLPDTSNGVSFSSELSTILRFRVGIGSERLRYPTHVYASYSPMLIERENERLATYLRYNETFNALQPLDDCSVNVDGVVGKSTYYECRLPGEWLRKVLSNNAIEDPVWYTEIPIHTITVNEVTHRFSIIKHAESEMFTFRRYIDTHSDLGSLPIDIELDLSSELYLMSLLKLNSHLKATLVDIEKSDAPTPSEWSKYLTVTLSNDSKYFIRTSDSWVTCIHIL